MGLLSALFLIQSVGAPYIEDPSKGLVFLEEELGKEKLKKLADWGIYLTFSIDPDRKKDPPARLEGVQESLDFHQLFDHLDQWLPFAKIYPSRETLLQ